MKFDWERIVMWGLVAVMAFSLTMALVTFSTRISERAAALRECEMCCNTAHSLTKAKR